MTEGTAVREYALNVDRNEFVRSMEDIAKFRRRRGGFVRFDAVQSGPDTRYRNRGKPMGKYDPLGEYLARQPQPRVELSFEQIEGILAAELPPSAYRYQAFWANNPRGHVHASAWLGAGWKVQGVDLTRKLITFAR